jgi:predicted DNA-binding antitoxin AbrB/MazE fold protein
MTQILKAVFDGKVFKPEEPVTIPPHTKVELMVHSVPKEKNTRRSFLKEIAELNLHGPSDWSEHFEEYLSGERKPE